MVDLSHRDEAPSRVEPRPVQLRSLTGLRFVAAFMVFAFHSTYLGMYPPGVQRVMEAILWQGGWSGVSFFFVLSGFVLTWSARPTDTPRAFWRRRFFKLYPNHVITFIAAAILLATVARVAFNGRDAFLNLLLIQSWFPQLDTRGSFNSVSWSLSCEALFYLSFPFLLRWIDRIRPERLWTWLGGMVAAIAVVPLLSSALPQNPLFPFARVTELEFWIIYQFPPTRMLDFVVGILLARIVLTGRKLPVSRGAAATLVVAAYAVSPLLPPAFSLVAVMVLPLGLLIAAAAKADAEARPSWMSSRIMVWLGDVSFAFYMWHALILFYVHPWLFGPASNAATALAEIALLFEVILVVSWLQFSRIERPMMRRFAVSRRDRPQVPAVAAVTPVHPDDRADAREG
ncbi:acyltransferase [Micromonospora sp. KC723]|uniref:acyltransferase family protein n=1 Tax=Micromonospora sp. KC723 TaxID=2530381 RepID=UPI00104E3033|nr:acyltransferase [Micromonospora sp. KC723]TDB76410.1 acyltransferase [Micromonospora sp. KC723]